MQAKCTYVSLVTQKKKRIHRFLCLWGVLLEGQYLRKSYFD